MVKMKNTAILSIVSLFLLSYAWSAPRYIETTRNANIRSGPSTSSTLVATSRKGDIFQLVEETENWYLIRMFSGSDRYLYKTLGRMTPYEPALPGTIEERRKVFREWKESDREAKNDADRRYPPESSLERNLTYFQLQSDRKKLDIAHKNNLQPPDLRRIVLEGNFKGW